MKLNHNNEINFVEHEKARLESIRREQLRLQRQFQFDQVHFFFQKSWKYQNRFSYPLWHIFFQWQKDEKLIMEQHLAEIKGEIYHLKIEDTPETKFEINCKLAALKIRVNDFIHKLENSFPVT